MRTRCGFTGGTTKNPTYRNIGDHTETMQIDFDPEQISYKQILELFWKSHNPCAKAFSRQYMSAVFYHSDEQKKVALETRDAAAAKREEKIVTPVLAAGTFTLAEDYHQKYYLRNDRELMKEFTAIYPNDKDFVNSTAAARVNGIVGGGGTLARLKKEIDSYGLSEKGRERLLEAARGR